MSSQGSSERGPSTAKTCGMNTEQKVGCVCAAQVLADHFQGNLQQKMKAPVAFNRAVAVVVMTHRVLTGVNAELQQRLKSER